MSQPFFKTNLTTLYCGDARHMTELPDESVHMVITSPPYHGLRKYADLPDTIWDEVSGCEHEWGKKIEAGDNRFRGENALTGGNPNAEINSGGKILSQFCLKCGAWRGQLGSEPNPELYISHLVEIFREVRRVLRPDGTCWINIGDSMASGKGTCYNPGGGEDSFDGVKNKKAAGVYPLDRGNISTLRKYGLKPLDRVGIPERLILALQADGWYWRSTIVWNKTNTMPESVAGWRWVKHKIKVDNTDRGKEASRNTTEGRPQQDHNGKEFKNDAVWEDCPGCPKCVPNEGLILKKGNWRPTDNFEYIYQLAKDVPYYSDGEAVRIAYTEPLNRWGGNSMKNDTDKTTGYKEMLKIGSTSAFRVGGNMRPNPAGANLRAVWTFPSTSCGYNHYAAFPPELPLRCIKAGSSEYGVCGECGAPYARIIDNKPMVINRTNHAAESGIGIMSSGTMVEPNEVKTLGWKSTCNCKSDKVIPSLVLDPFAGTGTTLEVATKLGRRSIGYEISPTYCEMIRDRCKQLGLL